MKSFLQRRREVKYQRERKVFYVVTVRYMTDRALGARDTPFSRAARRSISGGGTGPLPSLVRSLDYDYADKESADRAAARIGRVPGAISADVIRVGPPRKAPSSRPRKRTQP